MFRQLFYSLIASDKLKWAKGQWWLICCVFPKYKWRKLHWQLCFVAESKSKLYISYLVRSTMNSPWYNKSLVYPIWPSHQAIIKRSSFSSLGLFISLLWKKYCTIYLLHVTQTLDSETSWTAGPITASSLRIYDKVSTFDWNTPLWIALISFESLGIRNLVYFYILQIPPNFLQIT